MLDLMERLPRIALWLLKNLVAADDAKLLKLEPSTMGHALVIGVYVVLVAAVCFAIFGWASWRSRMEARFALRHGGQLASDATALYRWLLSHASALPFTESHVSRELVIKRNHDVVFTDRTTVTGDPNAALFAIGYELGSDERLKNNDKCTFSVRSLTDGVTVLSVPAEETLGKSR
ncbi:MAG: hypothetical protein JWM95_2964, partial [Gemmatimonadetes bacterium]|nr:hypothetical protein [Gemmatimonadota bacterium]